MEMENWRLELRCLFEVIERESIKSFRKINGYFQESGQTFDEEFRRLYLFMSNLKLDASIKIVQFERENRVEVIPCSSSSANGNQNAKDSNVLDSTVAENIGGRMMDVKNESNIDGPIEIFDSDDESDSNSSATEAPSRTNEVQIESNESAELSDGVDNSNTDRIDLTIENAIGVGVKLEPKIEIPDDEMIDMPLITFDPNEENDTISADAARTSADMLSISNQPTASTSAQAQPNGDGDKLFRCNDCTFSCRWKSHLNQHRRIHDANKPFKCTKCDYAARRNGDLKKHKLIHGGSSTKRFKCDHCDYAARQKGTLKIHQQRVHVGQKLVGIARNTINGMYNCPKCTLRFTDLRSLAIHFTASHKNNQRLFNCVHCLRGFAQKPEKDAHESRCKRRRYECHLCKMYVTSDLGHMKGHMRIHSGERPFKCAICEKCYRQKSTLNRHLDAKHGRTSN